MSLEGNINADDFEMRFVQTGTLSVAEPLHTFVEHEALPGTGISAAAFWGGFADIVGEFGDRNRQLLQFRHRLQSQIDAYHRERVEQTLHLREYERFLREIGYVLPETEDFTIRTSNVDEEIAEIAGSQLVVPLSNARYALTMIRINL